MPSSIETASMGSRSSVEGSPSRAASKFRHVFGQTPRREEWLDWGAGHGSLLAVNPKFAAVALEGHAGGPILVGRIGDMGKHAETRKLDDHRSSKDDSTPSPCRTPVTDFKWSEFNDNVLASGSVDGNVIVWHIDDSLKTSVVRRLSLFCRRVEALLWHSTVDNLLLVVVADPGVALWDVGRDSLLYQVNIYTATSRRCLSTSRALEFRFARCRP